MKMKVDFKWLMLYILYITLTNLFNLIINIQTFDLPKKSLPGQYVQNLLPHKECASCTVASVDFSLIYNATANHAIKLIIINKSRRITLIVTKNHI